MPPAVIAIAATIATAAVSYAAATAVISLTLAAILTVAIAIAAQVAVSLGRKPTGTRTNQGEELKLKLDPGMPRQIPLGRTATGGSIVWAFTYGSTENVPTNAYLVRIIAISDLPINALVGVYEGKQQLTFSGDPTTGLVACNQHHAEDGSTCMWLRVYKGSPTPTADANLISWAPSQWTSAHKGVNMSYAIARYLYDSEGDAFPNGEPSLVFVVDGVSCYDQRNDSTRGGRTGTQRLADPTTWAYTRNAAVEAQQVLRGFYSNGVLLMGAQADDQDLDDSMLLSAYNTCDESVSYSGGTQPRYRAGMMISSTQATADILVQLQAAMDGKIIDRAGNITIRPGATHTPVFSLTDDDVIWDMEKSWQPRMNLQDIYNFVDGVFVDEQTIFQEKPFPTQRSSAYETQDGGQRFEYQVAYAAATDWAQVQRMTKRIHLQSRLQGTVSFFLPLWALEMEQDDWFTMTSTRFGFTNKTFCAVTMDLIMSPGLMCSVVGREMDSTIDGWDPAVDEKARGDTTWTSPTGRTLPVPNVSTTAAVQTSTDNVVEQYGVTIGITGIGTRRGIASNLELQIAPTADLSQATQLGIFDAKNQTIQYWGLISNTGYSIRGRTFNGAQSSTWSSWSAFTAGLSTLNYFVTIQTSVILWANSDGTLNPTSQLPYILPVDITRGGNSIRTDNSVSYALTDTAGCTATINNTNGSSNKGRITVTALPGWTATLDLQVTVKNVVLPIVRVIIAKSSTATSGGGTSSGGSGTKSVNDATLNTISSGTFTAMSNTLTVTLASGESLRGSGTVSYSCSDPGGGSLNAKWQYSVSGAGSWTDFPSSPLAGTIAHGLWTAPNGTQHAAQNGSVTMSQTKGGLSAGNYDVRVMAQSVDIGNGNLPMVPSGTVFLVAS